MRGPATRHITTNRKANVITSQNTWLGYDSVLNGGKPPLFGSCWTVSVVAAGASCILAEHQDEGDNQTEQTLRFAKGEAEQQVGVLGLRGARIAQRTFDIAAEHVADADAGAGERDGCKTSADL